MREDQGSPASVQGEFDFDFSQEFLFVEESDLHVHFQRDLGC